MATSATPPVTDQAAPRVLIADDNPDVLQALGLLLKSEGYVVRSVPSPDALLRALASDTFDVVLIDLNYTRDTTSGAEGLELLRGIRALDPEMPVVAMTAWGTIELAVDAMRTGVDDFIQKPWDNAGLLAHLRAQVRQGRIRRKRREGAVDQEQELAAAREIQRSLLPQVLPAIPGLVIEAFWEPAGHVGGDFYDAASIDAGRAWLGIGDVEGKGISAALLMASVQARVRSLAHTGSAPGSLCTSVNDELCERAASGRFVSFFYCTYDAAHRRLLYANAGHPPPLLVRRDGTITRLSRGGPLLGVFSQARFEQEDIALEDGDRLVLFTDGITEAQRTPGGEFGDERLVRTASDARGVGARALQHEVLSAARAHCGGTFGDDATLIVMEIGGGRARADGAGSRRG
jgi:sigma-B regulation protein RsbU (phosphoserine phosphatase)